MHFAGRTWRPPYEAHSVIIQATSGCTYNQCTFCSLYQNECFRMSPLSEFEEDLAEIKRYQPNARRIFWTGANPFAMSYENLRLRALTVRDYLIKCQTMAMFASIRDIKDKEVWQSPLTRSHCSLTRGFMKWQDRDCLSLPEKKSVFVNCRLSLTTL